MTVFSLGLLPGAEPLELVYQSGDGGDDRLLTIVIGSYNHSRYLGDAFAAIEAAKTISRLSLIFIDDGSPDDTMAFVGAYRFDPRLQVRIFRKNNAGLCDSLSSGLALSATPFSCFIASDDYYVPEALDEIVARLDAETSPDVCWVCQAVYVEGRAGELVYGPDTGILLAAEPTERLRRLSTSFPKPLLLQSTVFGTNLLRRVGAWSDSLALDDWPTFIRIAKLAIVSPVDFRFIEDIILCRQRLHAGGVHNNLDRQLLVCLEVANTLIDERYRAEAVAHTNIDIGLIHLFHRRPARALRLFMTGLWMRPTPAVAAVVPTRILRSVFRRTKPAFLRLFGSGRSK